MVLYPYPCYSHPRRYLVNSMHPEWSKRTRTKFSPPNSDAMSMYSHGVVLRSDRVDYSVTKGGIRLWTTLFLFFLLIGGLANFMADTEDLLKENALDFDGDGDHDNIDDDESDMQVHETEDQDGTDRDPPNGGVRQRRRAAGEIHEEKESSEEQDGADDEDDDEPEEVDENEDYEAELLASIGRRRPGSGYESTEDHTEDIPKPVRYERRKGNLPPKAVQKHVDHDDTEEEQDESAADELDVQEERSETESTEEHSNAPSASIPKRKKVVIKTDPDEFVPDPTQPIKFVRTHGRLPKLKVAQHPEDTSEDGEEFDEDDEKEVKKPHAAERIRKLKILLEKLEEEDNGAPDPTKPVRYFRTKGTTPAEPEVRRPVNRTSSSDHDTPPNHGPLRFTRTKGTLPAARTKPSNSQPVEFPAPPMLRTKPDSPEPQKPIRYFRTKGALPKRPAKAETQAQPGNDAETDLPLPKPLRYYRTKGALPANGARRPTIPPKPDLPEQPTDVKKPAVRYFRTKGVKKGHGWCGKAGCPENVSGPRTEATSLAAKGESDSSAGSNSAQGVTTLVPVSSSYRKSRITNRDDNKIRSLLDEADRLLDQSSLEEALDKFKKLTDTYKRSPRAHFGYARTVEKLADKKQSNELLEESISAYEKVLIQPYVPDDLYLLAVERLVDRARFRGWMDRAADAQGQLVDRFPERLDLRNAHGVTFLMMGRNEDAKRVFADVLQKDPTNGFAQAHYGFILKTVDNDLENGAAYLAAGIASGHDGTHDGRFYFHLGDALQRLDRRDEAYEVYKAAADNDIFLSALQRSLHNVDHLTAKPWWTAKETGYARDLKEIERHWKVIREEGIHLLKKRPKAFTSEDHKLIAEGKWKHLTLFRRGRKVEKSCDLAPQTCEIVEEFSEAVNCSRGFVKFSVLEAGSKIHPHCGPTNCRLRGMLGLIVPAQPRIRVGVETEAWELGEFIIFDDSFEHELWNNGKELLLALVVDFWHPELSELERNRLEPI